LREFPGDRCEAPASGNTGRMPRAGNNADAPGNPSKTYGTLIA